MSFDAEKFCNAFGISASDRGKHSRPGWVQIVCPFCTGNPGWHGGFNINGGYYNCWRCGAHWIQKVIASLIKRPMSAAFDIARRYTSADQKKEFRERQYIGKIDYPSGTTRLMPQHLKYLIGRGYDPIKLIRQFDLKGTGNIGDYKNRIVAPIYMDGKLISYTSRDITGNHDSKYMACPDDQEVFHHKYSLYGLDQSVGDSCLIMEGITDVWNLGPGSLGTHGIDYQSQQVILISRRFKRSFILYDAEYQAQEKAMDLYTDLTSFNVDCEILSFNDLGEDPGNMSSADADEFMQWLGIR